VSDFWGVEAKAITSELEGAYDGGYVDALREMSKLEGGDSIAGAYKLDQRCSKYVLLVAPYCKVRTC
jgi:hypothetical protein